MPDYTTRRRVMVDTQVRPSDVTKFPVIDALLSVPRERYVPSERREAAYVGENLPLARGRVVLDPRTLAKMLDLLDLQPGEAVLDIGCGLGYSSRKSPRWPRRPRRRWRPKGWTTRASLPARWPRARRRMGPMT
jgi:hypothetical protein